MPNTSYTMFHCVDTPLAALLPKIEDRTAPCPYDGTWPNFYDCTTYIMCTNGISYVMPCPNGNLIINLECVDVIKKMQIECN